MNALAGSPEGVALSIAKISAIQKQLFDNVAHSLGKGVPRQRKIQQSHKAIGSGWNTIFRFQPKKLEFEQKEESRQLRSKTKKAVANSSLATAKEW